MTPNDLPGVVLTPLEAHSDERGRFVEIQRESTSPARFAQTNHSRSEAGVLRGLHYHRAQADLWYVVTGRIQVALADLRTRTDEPATATLVLDGAKPAILYIPEGVTHGFLALTDVDMIYCVTREFDGSDEYGIAWNDPTLAIDWQISAPALSERDRSNPDLRWNEIPSF